MKKIFTSKLYVIVIFLSFCKNIYGQTTIYMQKEGGVFTVPCIVNGIKLKFIFDTGASDVSISLTEANFMLKNGYLKNEDILGKENYSDATGNISEGTKINIRKIEFEGYTLYDVKASIVHTLSAPLLLGQSAMAKLGKFQLDPNNGTLTIIGGTNNLTKSVPNNSIISKKPNNTTKPTESEIQAEAKRVYNEKYAGVIAAKAAYLAETKATGTKTPSGLIYKITQKGTGVKPADGTTFNFNYSGYFEDGTLFDSNHEEVCKTYGKHDANRAAQNGYKPYPIEAGKKSGMIPGFLEGLSLMSYGDKAIIFIPSNLAYGESGAGGVIPPNATLVFEVEMLEIKAEAKQ